MLADVWTIEWKRIRADVALDSINIRTQASLGTDGLVASPYLSKGKEMRTGGGSRTAERSTRCDQESSERKGQLSKGRISCSSCVDTSNAKSQSNGTTNSATLERLTVPISSDLGGRELEVGVLVVSLLLFFCEDLHGSWTPEKMEGRSKVSRTFGESYRMLDKRSIGPKKVGRWSSKSNPRARCSARRKVRHKRNVIMGLGGDCRDD